MTLQLASNEVWQEVEKNMFAVLGMVTAQQEARTVGIVYVVRNRKIYIASNKHAWKARHIIKNPHVSLTVTVAKRIPFMPWIPIPAATITFSGEATVHNALDVDEEIVKALYRGIPSDQEILKESCVIEVQPVKDFVTYGIGIPPNADALPRKSTRSGISYLTVQKRPSSLN